MGKRKACSEDERLERKRASRRKSSKKYYQKNTELLREKQRKLRGTKKHRNIVMIDTTSGEEFEYRSVKECSDDMGINAYRINKGLTEERIYKGYKFKRRD